MGIVKIGLFFMIFSLVISFVCAADSWDSFSDSENLSTGSVNQTSNSAGDEPVNTNVSDSESSTSSSTSDRSSSTGSSSEGSFKYNDNFYIALGVGAVGVLIVILLILSFILKPRNKWKR